MGEIGGLMSLLETNIGPRIESILPEPKFKDGLQKFDPGNVATILFSLGQLAPTPDEKYRLTLVALKLSILSKIGTKLADRELIELHAGDQCGQVFAANPVTRSGFPTTKDENSRCWLCGFTVAEMGSVLGDKAWTRVTPRSDFYNAPECEHILPAGAAILYLDIPRAGVVPDPNLIVNYEWSHRHCNGKKSSLLFIDMFDDAGNVKTPVPSESLVGNYVNALSTSSIIQNLLAARGIPVDTWKQTRFETIGNRVKMVTDNISSRRIASSAGRPPIVRGFYEHELTSIIYRINVSYNKTVADLTRYGDAPIPVTQSQIEDALNRFNQNTSEILSDADSIDPQFAHLIPPSNSGSAAFRLHSFIINLKTLYDKPESVGLRHIIDTQQLPTIVREMKDVYTSFTRETEPLTGNQFLELMRQQRDLYIRSPEHIDIYNAIRSRRYAQDPRFCGPEGVLSDIYTPREYQDVCRVVAGRGRKTFRRKHNGVSKRSNKHTYRKSPRSHRKSRTSDRGRVKTGTRKDARE